MSVSYTKKKTHREKKKTTQWPLTPTSGHERRLQSGSGSGSWCFCLILPAAGGLGILPTGDPVAFPRKGGDRRMPCWLGRTCSQLSAGC